MVLDDGPAAEREKFESALEPLLVPAYRLALTLLGSRTEAEDAVQDAAFKAWRKRDNLFDGSDLRPWFFAIVVNQCRTLRRGRWFHVIRQPEVEPDPGSGDAMVTYLDLRRSLGRLRQSDRAALVLRFYMDLSFEELAEILGISVEAAKTRTQRAVRTLRARMDVREELR
jgi:RNA polymerase sigma-70 factor, ECF subfamily